MTTETVLTDVQIEQGRQEIFSTNNPFCPCDSKAMRKAVRWAEHAVLQSPEVQQIRALLKEARHQLPLAAHFWNEDDEPERGQRNLAHVMELIAKIDAAMEKKE